MSTRIPALAVALLLGAAPMALAAQDTHAATQAQQEVI